MKLLSKILVGIVALEHIYILILEMFLWTTPLALNTFGFTPEFAEQTAAFATNQGIYNGFLAAGLIWSLLHPNGKVGRQLAIFFTGCVIVAAVVGGVTVQTSILFTQGTPAVLALLSILLLRNNDK